MLLHVVDICLGSLSSNKHYFFSQVKTESRRKPCDAVAGESQGEGRKIRVADTAVCKQINRKLNRLQ